MMFHMEPARKAELLDFNSYGQASPDGATWQGVPNGSLERTLRYTTLLWSTTPLSPEIGPIYEQFLVIVETAPRHQEVHRDDTACDISRDCQPLIAYRHTATSSTLGLRHGEGQRQPHHPQHLRPADAPAQGGWGLVCSPQWAAVHRTVMPASVPRLPYLRVF